MRKGYVLQLALFLVALAMPYVLDDYLLYIVTLAGTYIIAAQGLNVLTGLSGQISFGHAGFVAIGAYISALVAVHWTSSLLVIWLLSILANSVVGLFFGYICLRMVGPYLALATIGFGIIVQVIAKNLRNITGGAEGILGIPSLSLGPIVLDTAGEQYYLMLFAVIVTLLAVKNLRESRVGLAIMATRDDAIAAQLTGINIAYYKILAFMVSGILAGITGSLLVNLTNTVFPEEYGIHLSGLLIVIIVIGGMGDIAGVTLGALIIVGVFELLRDLREYQLLVHTCTVILIMMYMPSGVMGLIRQSMRGIPGLRITTPTIPRKLLKSKK